MVFLLCHKAYKSNISVYFLENKYKKVIEGCQFWLYLHCTYCFIFKIYHYEPKHNRCSCRYHMEPAEQ